MDDVFRQYLSLYVVLMLAIVQLGIILAAKISGWSLLSKKYTIFDAPMASFHHFQSMRLGICNYSACMSFALSPEGLYMKVFFLFSAGHPPLLIPWTNFSDGGKPGWNIFYGRAFYIDTDKKKVKIVLSKKISQEILSNGYITQLSN